MSVNRPAAFFDMDKTLISVNSARLWVEHMWREGELTKRDLLRSAASLLRYQFALVDMDKVARDGALRLRGTPESVLIDRVGAWYEAQIRATIRASMLDVVEEHRRRGDHLVLLTASSPYVARPLGVDVGIDDHLSTRFEVVDGHFTGELEALCYGAGKVAMSESWAAEHGVDLDRSWFYTDSYTDVPMLERVGNPVVVHPDPRLARWARQRNIPVVTS